MSETASPTLSLQELRNTAELLERQVLASGGLTEAQVAGRRPGGTATYADESPSAWLAYALWLAEHVRPAAVTGSGRGLTQVLHEALADEPVPVTLASGQIVRVFPKSLNTLLVLEGLDADLRQTLETMRTVALDPEVESAAGVAFVGALLKATALRMYVWILTHEGPGLPFGEHETDVTPPEWTTELVGADLEAIVVAHMRVNRQDLEVLAHAFPTEERPTNGRLPLSGFLGAQAAEDGLAPKHLIYDRTLRSIFAASVVRAEMHRQAHAAAKVSREDT